MALGARPELVGKRFVCVVRGGEEPPELGEIGQIGRWGWRAGVIRAVTHRDNSNPELAVYVEFDDLEWDKREWVKVYEDFTAFFVEFQLVWAKKKDPSQAQGSKVKQVQWPALAFKPLVGNGAYKSITAIEFLVERHLEFATEDSAFQPYQDEVDSLNPVLRDNPQLHEEVKAWVKEHKVQEIFMQGPYSLNGYRVRVYRQDSATQWFTGIITHHDLFTRTMIVMNDQVLEPQNVDPSMVQMTFLDDVVYSLLKGENIGITSRRRSRSNQNSNTIHGHYTRAQANSPRPAMNSQSSTKQSQNRNARLNKRKGSDSSMPDEDRIKEERFDENVKRNKHFHSKRRKPEEDEKKEILKRLRTDNISDCSESSDSENSNKRIIDSSSEQNSENELKSKNTSKINGDEGKSQSSKGAEEQTLIDRHPHWDEIQEDKKLQDAERLKSADLQLQKENSQFLLSEQTALYEQNSNKPLVQDSVVERSNTTELLQTDQLAGKPPTPKNSIVLTNENSLDKTPQESSSTKFNTQPNAKKELQSSDPKQSFGTISYSSVKKQESEHGWNDSVNHKTDLALSGVLKTPQSTNKEVNDREKIHHTSVIGSTSLTDEQKRLQKQTLDALKAKPHISENSSKIKFSSSPDMLKSRPVHSPDSVKLKVNYHNNQTSGVARPLSKMDSDSHRSSFHPVTARASAIESTKSPLIIDKNEHFTVYRDPALVGPDTAANHISPYLHQHNFTLHSPAHRACLPPNNHHPALTANPHMLTSSSNQTPMTAINAHALGSTSHHSVHHPHLLPTVLPGMPPGSLLGGHPQLETAHASSLSHLALAHQQQQQMLQHQPPHLLGQAHPPASYNQLGLYPIIWQYPNGSHAYSSLGLPSSKWVHPENHVNAEASIRRNTASPWLHQPTPVTSADGLLMGHLPVRPSSADSLRPLKLAAHSSPPLSKPSTDHHKEDLEKKTFSEPLRSVSSAPVKSEHEHNRTHVGKDGHIHRHYMEPVLSHTKLPRSAPDSGERPSKYKDEHRRILQENIEASSFSMKMKAHENERESYARVTPILSCSPKSHLVKQENNVERPISDLYKMKNSVSQSLPQSNYFTTLSNSVVNEPPRSYTCKEAVSVFPEKQNASSSSTNSSTNSYMSSLSKPPPLIKHQPEDGAASKLNEQLPQQVATHTITSYRGDSRSPTQLSVSSSNALRSMPALHRAPVFHPPIHHSLDRKDVGYSNLSPPTLTPVQPVTTGGKIQELQKPPTLVPEPKEGAANYKKNTEKPVQEMWKANEKQNHSKIEWMPEKNNVKLPSATASVIVRPPSSAKYDNMPATQAVPKERVGERSLAGINQSDCIKPLEIRETTRIAQPLMNSDSAHGLFEKNAHAPSHNIPSSSAPGTNIMCSTKTDVTTSAPTTTSVSSCGGSEVTYSLSNAVSTCTVIESTGSISGTPTVSPAQEGTANPAASASPASSKTASAIQPNSLYPASSDFFHLKKHKAALAAAQLKSTNANDPETNAVKNQTFPASGSPESNAPCSSTNTTSSTGTGQASQCSQPNYHTKLKKAWLTRHSEEDKNTNTKPESASSSIVSEIIKPCTVNLIASTSSELQNNIDLRAQEDKSPKEDRLTRRRVKRTYESGSETEDSDESESKSGQRLKRQPKPTYKKKQNDMQRRKGDTDKEEEIKPNGILSRSAKEKSKLKLQSNSSSTGIPRSVLKDWRKVKKLKQTGESFLQDDSCCEIGPNLQKCRECRLIRTKKGEESTHSPVFCRFYYFRRLSFSKNGVVRIDGFSTPDQYDDEALSLWTHENYEDDELDLESIKYILGYIGDKFCQMVTSEKAAMSWVKKDAKIAWKRAVRGVREMCDACEATLFNIHWVCQKCGFVVCLDCYKAKERKSSRDKELYTWLKCVKGQPHDYKHLMPTQIIPSSVLTDLLEAMHSLRDKFGIKSHCQCTGKQASQSKYPAMNGVSQVLQNVLNHSNKISLSLPESQQHSPSQKPETNGNASPGSDTSTDSKLASSESHSSLHWLADLAEQKAREEKKENKEVPMTKHIKEEQDGETTNSKSSSPTSQNSEQGSTLRDLLTTTAGKLRLGSTDAGIAFAPVYSAGNPGCKGGRSMPNILDDIIASVVENKIPATRPPKPIIKSEPKEEISESRKPPLDENTRTYNEIPHSWICDRHILWLKDHRHNSNWKLFRDCWKQGKTVVVSGNQKRMNPNLWKSESISHDFGDHQGDLLNCKEGVVSSGNVKEFWDGFEDVAKRQKLKSGETILLKLKDQPSGEDFKNMMPARHEDFFRMLPVPEYCNPDGKFNLASHMPTFFVRPDLGPRLCSAYGVIATKDHDTGTTNLHIEVSDMVNILVYVGVVKGNVVASKAGVVKKFEEEDMDECLKKRLKDTTEVPGSLWHIYETKDADKIREFLHKAAKEQCLEILPDHDPIRDQNWYLNKKLRQSLLEDYGVKSHTLVQFLGDAVILPAGAIYQVQNFHSCIQVTQDFVSPEHLVHSFHLTQELRLSKEEINFDDKLQVKNILYHSVKEMVRSLKIHEEEMEDMDES
ncbi:putative JmjC domain-containing histone demethylation protein 2C isoform 4-T4 [Leptodactylus fuscus]|uniref:putative JmjC domain-containing histone demethylation protein 2C isoform X4 n=1 Tax=Leptodactylus fuscus TaxID=238119 RepID=UPI003F4E7B76